MNPSVSSRPKFYCSVTYVEREEAAIDPFESRVLVMKDTLEIISSMTWSRQQAGLRMESRCGTQGFRIPL